MDIPNVLFKSLFPYIHAARRLLNPPKWTPPLGSNDPSFPSTHTQDVYVVHEIYAALRDPGPFWRSSDAHVVYRQHGILKLPKVLRTGDEGFADEWLEAVAWEALERMKTLYREGFTAPTDPTNHVSPDRQLSFFDRLQALCSLLRDWKCACDMMAGPAQDYACVALPFSYRKIFEHRAHQELQRAQQLAALDVSLTKKLADLAKNAADCGLSQVPLPASARMDLGVFNLDVVLVDAVAFEQFLQKQRSVFSGVAFGTIGNFGKIPNEMDELFPPSKRRKTGD